jgi:tripartite-type tricarboxylate transporter receptor subunit TctC
MKKRSKRIGLGLYLGCLVFFFTASVSTAAEEFPTKPIDMLVAYRAGGLVDTMARALAQNMEKFLGQPIVIINKEGAGGALALTALKNSKPDGYTIGATTANSVSFTPLVEKVGYTLDDFDYLGSVGRFQEAVVSAPDRPWKNFKELIEYSKKHPGLSFASMDPIGTKILEYIAKKEGIEWRAIPTKGGSEVMTAILGNHVDFGFSGGIHVSFCKAGKMIVLAGFERERLLASPNVPTLKEDGYDVVFQNNCVIPIPKGAPEAVVRKLSVAVEKAAKDPKYVDLLENKLEIPAVYQGGEELGKNIQDFNERMRKLLEYLKK